MPVGEAPVLVAPPATLTDASGSPDPVDGSDRRGSAPGMTSQRGSRPPVHALRRQAMMRGGPASPPSYLRKGQMVAALVGTLAFFIPWSQNGFTGIVYVTQASWTWWSPPSPQLLFSFLLIALVLSYLGRDAVGSGVSALVAVLGLVLVIFCCDYLWEFRHDFDILTGFWIVVASSVLLVGFAGAAMRADASHEAPRLPAPSSPSDRP